MKLYKKIISATLIAVCIILSSCNDKSTTETVSHADVIPTKLTIGMYQSDSYNPLDTTTFYNEQAYFLIFDSLYNINEKFEAEANLATDISIENSGNTAVVQLKPNVKFHDGSSLTAHDVKYTVEHILKNGGYYAYNVRNIESVSVINDYTVKFNLKYHTPNIMLQLTFPIVPSENPSALFGTGPYKLLNEKTGKQVDLIKNENYHNTYNSNVNKIEINLIPDKLTARSLSGSGILDIFFAAFSDEGLKTVTKSQSAKRDYLTDNYVFLKLNFNNKLINTKQFRKALNLGINRQKIADDAYMSHAQPTSLPVPFQASFYNTANTTEQRNSEATELLKEIGYEDTDSDGIIEYTKETDEENPMPEIPRLNILIRNDTLSKSVAECIVGDLKKLGIFTSLTVCEAEDYTNNYNDSNYDLCLVNTSLGLDLDTEAFLGKNGIFSAPVDYNYKEALLKIAATPLTELKMPTYTNLFNGFYDNPSHIPLVYLKNTLITNDKFKNFDELYLNNLYYKILLGGNTND